MSKWKRLRVVVEVPVRVRNEHEGPFDVKDFIYATEDALVQRGFWRDTKHIPPDARPQFGRVRVVEYNKHMNALATRARKKRVVSS